MPISFQRHRDNPVDSPPLYDFTGDTSYPTGGYPLNLQPEFRSIQGIIECGATTLTYKTSYNPSTVKLQLFVLATGVEVANAVDVSGTTFTLAVCGTS